MSEKKTRLGTANALMDNVKELVEEGKLQIPIGTAYLLSQLQQQIDEIKIRLIELEKVLK